MTFRIFQVSTDGVASAVYREDTPPKTTAGASAGKPTAAESAPAEWHELRDRLRQQPTPKSVRKSWLRR